ncbi:MAG TPA: hypothetical protein VFB76_19125 [Candidatus Angelobacter sp.]|nr:hypothetical protein [Candidatus Angelobacter sp.]
MKTAVGVSILLAFAALCSAQSPVQSGKPQQPQQPVQVMGPPVNLDAILAQVQKATSSASVNIGHLRIEKWRTDADQKQQLQQIAEALQRNIATALPGLMNDVQTSKGGVLASFKLYHNLNVVYENLSYLADVTGSLGKKEEFEPLAQDAQSLESARSNLSTYIEQTATKLEVAYVQLRTAEQAREAAAASAPPKVMVIDDDTKPKPKKKSSKSSAKTTKKKASPSPTPAQAAGSPH